MLTRDGTAWRLLLGALAASGCARGMNYSSLEGPRYVGGIVPDAPPANAPDSTRRLLRLVTFNTRHALQVDSAIALLRLTPTLEGADIVALQEVDAPATERIARSLGMTYVYYPATLHPKFGRDFGNAILTRWPIVADRKLVLPHLGRFRRTVRTATAATITVDGAAIRVYSTHLGTPAEIGPRAKRDQLRVIMTDAAAYAHVIILGDMNSHAVGKRLHAAGYRWPTEHNPRTLRFGNWDHVFLKGIALAHDSATGVVADSRRASDHRAVWAVVGPARTAITGPSR